MRLSPSAKKTLLYTLAGVLAVLLLAQGIFLWKRQQLLAYALEEVKTRVERKYPVRLTLGPAHFTGMNTVEMSGLSLVPTAAPGTDTLFTARRLQAGLSVRSLFAGRPVFSELNLDDARLTARKTGTGPAAHDNYSFLLKKKTARVPARDTARGTNYGLLLNQVLEAGFDNVPGEANFRRLQVRYDSPRHRARLDLPELRIEDNELSGRLTARVDSVVNELGLSGTVEPGDYALDLRVFGRGSSVQVPYVPERFGALVSFDTVRVQLTGKDFDGDDETGGQLTLRGTVAARNFSLYHPKLAAEEIVVRRGQLDFVAGLGRARASLEKGTRAVLNKLVFYPELAVRLKPSKAIRLDVRSEPTATNDFFNSLPPGIFDEVIGTQGTGTLTYRLHTDLDLALVDSLKFDSSLRPSKDFAVTRFGAEDLNKLNQDFAYTAYNDRGDSLRTFKVGPSNPDFVPYGQVSDYLKKAITTAEDPRFFTHRGFMEKAFVKSAVQNIKERRFARGGSTISMQLVKNVFLSRQKTIGRKAEEALMVWLIENTRLVSKERLFEVYLNVIEWGPSRYRWPSGKRGVYGVKDAALFYYGKRPNELSLTESLYLASIIPKPKLYQQSFNQYGELRGSTRYFFRLIADIMETRGLISGGERGNLAYALSINGPARPFIVRAVRDTARTVQPGDTAQFEPLNLIDLLNTGAPPASPDAGVNTNAPEPPDGRPNP